MKKLLLFIGILVANFYAKAQVTLEHIYPQNLDYAHFSAVGYKYYYNTNTTLNIYNLNHSVYKIITFPNIPNSSKIGRSVGYVSDSLFNTNTSNIEYVLSTNDSISTNGNQQQTILDDAGNIILRKDSAYVSVVYFTTSGYKMLLNENANINSNSYVYSLPGALPCDECTSNHVLSGMAKYSGNSGTLMNVFPNPNSGMATIKYQLPDGVTKGDIILFNLQGQEINRFTVDKTFDSLNLTTTDIASGTYFYVLRTTSGDVGVKKMVVIK
jgi:hypothetical protein